MSSRRLRVTGASRVDLSLRYWRRHERGNSIACRRTQKERATSPACAASGTHVLTVFEESRRAYRALGQQAAITMSVDDAEHESTRKNREATYAFFQHYLDLPGDSTDIQVAQLTSEELRVTETGYLATSLRGD